MAGNTGRGVREQFVDNKKCLKDAIAKTKSKLTRSTGRGSTMHPENIASLEGFIEGLEYALEIMERE
jgi:hypothetical protein